MRVCVGVVLDWGRGGWGPSPSQPHPAIPPDPITLKPRWPQIGSGVLLAAVLEDGGVALLDTWHHGGNRLRARRQLQGLLGGSWPFLPGTRRPSIPCRCGPEGRGDMIAVSRSG